MRIGHLSCDKTPESLPKDYREHRLSSPEGTREKHKQPGTPSNFKGHPRGPDLSFREEPAPVCCLMFKGLPHPPKKNTQKTKNFSLSNPPGKLLDQAMQPGAIRLRGPQACCWLDSRQLWPKRSPELVPFILPQKNEVQILGKRVEMKPWGSMPFIHHNPSEKSSKSHHIPNPLPLTCLRLMPDQAQPAQATNHLAVFQSGTYSW